MIAELSTAEVLRRAKQVLIERGWTQGRYSDSDGSVCIAGAVNFAVNGNPVNFSGAAFPKAMLCRIVGLPLTRFNDLQHSVVPVLAAFDAAIALAESEAS